MILWYYRKDEGQRAGLRIGYLILGHVTPAVPSVTIIAPVAAALDVS